MTSSALREWKKFPYIDISKGYISDNEILLLAKHYDICLNIENKDIVDILMKYNRIITFPRDLQFYIKSKITNVNNKRGGSTVSKEFWLVRGFTEEEAKIKISEIQKKKSKRCNEFWISKGFTEEEAKIKVSEIQSICGKKKGKPRSYLSIDFWLARGFTEEESKIKVSEIQKKNSKKLYEKYSKKEFKKINKMCLDYWLSRGYNILDYENYRNSLKMHECYRSKIADDFVLSIKDSFEHKDLIYCCDNEYGKYIKNFRYVRYDYIDLKLKIAIEFNGNYWHKNTSEIDSIKKSFIESLGFKYICVNENEYRKNKELVIKNVLKEINENN